MDPNPLLSVAEVAVMLGLSTKTVHRLAATGVLPSVRIGERVVRFEPAVLDAYIASRRRGPDLDPVAVGPAS